MDRLAAREPKEKDEIIGEVIEGIYWTGQYQEHQTLESNIGKVLANQVVIMQALKYLIEKTK